jgi:hypothetical protein
MVEQACRAVWVQWGRRLTIKKQLLMKKHLIRERCIMKKMNFKTSNEPESSKISNSRPFQSALILRNLLGGATERTLVRKERQQRKNSKESHYEAASINTYKIDP